VDKKDTVQIPCDQFINPINDQAVWITLIVAGATDLNCRTWNPPPIHFRHSTFKKKFKLKVSRLNSFEYS